MYSELESSYILSQLDKNIASDPNVNYEILANIINVTMSKHMPNKKIKLHKHKHKQKKSKWITTGIIKSIKFCDNLHKRLKQTLPVTLEFWNIKQNLKVYNKILKRSIDQVNSAGAIVKNLAPNVNLSYCMDLWTLGSKLQKKYCWTFFQ